MTATNCSGYAVLSHEAIIDSAWDVAIKPALLQRFPNATPDELKAAHAYAYGGCVIQDMGYYPFGNKLFSDLLHYVRTGDFIEALLRDSQDINDYAFALGAMAHYAADNNGHRMAVNLSVPMLYPKLKKKFGDVVTYDENPAAHLKTEFGFDVIQIARGRYAPDDYRDHIGFEVAKPLLQKAFEETYALKLDSMFTSYDLAVGTYRRAVSAVIPSMTKVAWQTNKDEIQKEIPGITRKQFLYHLSRSSYKKNWHEPYRRPGFGTRFLAFLIQFIPKVGPFRALSFKTPTPETEKLFMASFNATIEDYEKLVQQQKDSGHVALENDNFDVGGVTGPGQYPLADETYADLLDRLAQEHFASVTPELRDVILNYYADANAPQATKKNKKEWTKVNKEVNDLKAATPSSTPAPATSTN
ncbi:MAG TPA: zinc dependent phospholipase C family protein [Candidatus Acidoferrales bacterium]|nr:zinc dependent phospholipase C family protein [Candidatus Acidoferrales bacterium]